MVSKRGHKNTPQFPPFKSPRLTGSASDDGDNGDDNNELMLGIYDISRAHFMPKVKRELYIEIPKEDLTASLGDGGGEKQQN